MYSPYSRTFSGDGTRPRRRSSAKTRIEASGVRSSWETLETKSDFICDSFTARLADRRDSRMPPISTMARSPDSVMLKAKLARAQRSGVDRGLCSDTVQSSKTNGKRRVTAAAPSSAPGGVIMMTPPRASRTVTTSSSRAASGKKRGSARAITDGSSRVRK